MTAIGMQLPNEHHPAPRRRRSARTTARQSMKSAMHLDEQQSQLSEGWQRSCSSAVLSCRLMRPHIRIGREILGRFAAARPLRRENLLARHDF